VGLRRLPVDRGLGHAGRRHYAEIIAAEDPTCADSGDRCFRTDEVRIGHQCSAPGATIPKRRRFTVVVALAVAFTVAVLAGCGGLLGQDDENGASGGAESPPTPSDDAPDPDAEDGTSTDDESAADESETEDGVDAGGGNEDGGALDNNDRGQVEDVPGLLEDEEAGRIIGELEGQLAIGDGNVVAVARPDGNSYQALDGDSQLIAAQPTWSRAGDKLVWSSVSALRQLARVQSFDEEGVTDGAPLDSEAQGPPVFYYQWTDDGDTIMYLRNSPTGSGIEAGALIPGRPIEPVDGGAPFFVSWSPTGDRVAANVDDRSVRIYDQFASVAQNGASPGDDTPVFQLLMDGTGFSAPAWIDENTVLIVLDGWLTALVLDENGQERERVRVTQAATPVRFVVSPDRRRVAYQAVDRFGPEIDQAGLATVDDRGERSGSRPIGPGAGLDAAVGVDPVQVPVLRALVVYDLETGSRETVTDDAALAWEWSPDGTKLAWLRPESAGGRGARWRFWSVDGAQPAGDRTTPVVAISAKEALNYLPFFAQYTQSVNRWSPDSTAFAIAGGITPTSGPPRQGIWVHLVDQPARPVLVAEGDFVTWGSGPTPPATGSSPA
jgi:TolB protein